MIVKSFILIYSLFFHSYHSLSYYVA